MQAKSSVVGVAVRSVYICVCGRHLRTMALEWLAVYTHIFSIAALLLTLSVSSLIACDYCALISHFSHSTVALDLIRNAAASQFLAHFAVCPRWRLAPSSLLFNCCQRHACRCRSMYKHSAINHLIVAAKS